jgi:hypothetical protein
MLGAQAMQREGGRGFVGKVRARRIWSRALLVFALVALCSPVANSQERPPPVCAEAAAGGHAVPDTACTAPDVPTASVKPVLAQSGWLAPLGSGPRGPAAGSLLAGVCLAWLALLLIATVVRPRGWHHKPLFPGLRRRT